ncbi:MAG: serine/threonine-protein kinase [Clostridia bacterium]
MTKEAMPVYPESFFERYELLYYLSGDGRVALAKEKRTGIRCVTRVRPREAGQRDEGEILSALSHPAIPRLIEQIEGEQSVVLVREYIAGQTLAKWIEGEHSRSTKLNVCTQICDILIYLHEQRPQVIHRDIKPQNVIIRPNGDVALVDFDISRRYKRDERHDTVFLGTQGFAPPEQYGFSQTDARADIYSLGALFLWMCTGDTDLRRNIASVSDRSTRRIIQKCMALDPEMRYKNARSLRFALMNGAKIQRRIALLAAALAALALCVLAGLGFYRFGPVSFQSPLVAAACKSALGLPENAWLSREKLKGVEELYFSGDQFFPSDTAYWGGCYVYGNEKDLVYGIETLEDFRMMPNLKSLFLGRQGFSDLSPLLELALLERLDLNSIEGLTDLSVLPQLKKLYRLGVALPGKADLSPIAGCERLGVLNLTINGEQDDAFLRDLRDLDQLHISSPDLSRVLSYLRGKSIMLIRIVGATSENIPYFAEIAGLKNLDFYWGNLQTMEGIEACQALEGIRFNNTIAPDLSPLLKLPRLNTLTVDSLSSEKAEEIRDKAKFSIVIS